MHAGRVTSVPVTVTVTGEEERGCSLTEKRMRRVEMVAYKRKVSFMSNIAKKP